MDSFPLAIKLFLIEISKYLNVVTFPRHIVSVMLSSADGNLALRSDLD